MHDRSRQAGRCAPGAQPWSVGVGARRAGCCSWPGRVSCAASLSSKTDIGSRASSRSCHPPTTHFSRPTCACCEIAKRHSARIPFDALDLLIVDELGKTISGGGMDPNVIGLWRNSEAPHHPNYRRIVVLSLTYPSLGNGLGHRHGRLHDASIRRGVRPCRDLRQPADRVRTRREHERGPAAARARFGSGSDRSRPVLVAAPDGATRVPHQEHRQSRRAVGLRRRCSTRSDTTPGCSSSHHPGRWYTTPAGTCSREEH